MNIQKSSISLLLILLVAALKPYPATAADAAEKAIQRLEATAAKGNVESQSKLGTMYTYGIGTRRDLEMGRAWLTRAAESGNSAAQMHLGLMYLRGRGVEKSNQEAMAWLKKAADQGEPDAIIRYAERKRVEEYGAKMGVMIQGDTNIDDECSKRQYESTRIAVGISAQARKPSENIYADCVDMKVARRSLGIK